MVNGSFGIPPLTDGVDVPEVALARDTVLMARSRGRLLAAAEASGPPNRTVAKVIADAGVAIVIMEEGHS